MELLLAVLIAAYAVRGVGADVAAAVAGKTPPSVLKWEARQKRREQPKKDPGYFGRIWNNALESWADRSTKRHQRRMAVREKWEARKGPEWVERKLAKLEKAAARRQRFAEKSGVLWGKAREAAENVRERRREDEAWEANARFDAERDGTAPAGLQGSADLDEGADQDKARVLPFRPRDDEHSVDGDGDSVVHEQAKPDESCEVPALHEMSAAVDFMTCLWGIEDGTRCTAIRLDDSAYCGDHKLMDDRRCKWKAPDGERCAEPVYGRSPFCVEHHSADPEMQAAIEACWGQATSSATDLPADGGQDINTETEKENTMSMSTNAPAEITSLSDAIAYTQAMQNSLAAVDAQVDQWSADLKAFAEKARAAHAEVETAVASLRGLGLEGHQVAVLESAREHMEAIAQVFGGAAERVGAASDSAQAGASAFGQAHQAFTAQTGISEQMQAAAASGNRAGKREFYEAG